MSNSHVQQIQVLLSKCSKQELKDVFTLLRKSHNIHEYEDIVGAPAEMILEAVHRAPELTRRMLRGVIADAAFSQFIVPALSPNWADVTPKGNYAYDYILADKVGAITIQVKLQRSAKGAPVVKQGARYNFDGEIFTTETQKTRGGKDGEDNPTRPYRYGEFDILAVAMQPSTGKWDTYMYTVGEWLVQGKNANELATIQPVAKTQNEFWTDDFNTVAKWHRAHDSSKRMKIAITKKTAPKKLRKQ